MADLKDSKEASLQQHAIERLEAMLQTLTEWEERLTQTRVALVALKIKLGAESNSQILVQDITTLEKLINNLWGPKTAE